MFTIKLEDFDIKKIAESGQCFRMTCLGREELREKWQLIAGNQLAYAYVDPFTNETIIDCPGVQNNFWIYYFDLATDYAKYRNSVDEDDIFLLNAEDFGKGIRILRQFPWEMLITYIISQRRSIPSIKTCVERLCKRWGDEISEGVYAFPTAEQLAKASVEDLSDCGLGYRAEYVYLATQKVALGEIDLLAWDEYSDEKLMEELLKLKGVGIKVANCVSLFGYYRVAAFPVDVWIDRVQKQFYMGRFPIEKYPGYAGIMQQYIFYYIRNGLKE